MPALNLEVPLSSDYGTIIKAKLDGKRVALALADLDDAGKPSDLDLPGYRLHPLKGALKGFWSISVSGNWGIIFRFDDGDAYDVDLVDSH